jgi:hypothetical protein
MLNFLNFNLKGRQFQLWRSEIGPESGCIVLNSTKEPVKVCITDKNNRTTHLMLASNEHNLVHTPSGSNVVSIYDFNLEASSALIKLNTTPNLKPINIHNQKYSDFNFIRILFKDGHYTLQEEKRERNSENFEIS